MDIGRSAGSKKIRFDTNATVVSILLGFSVLLNVLLSKRISQLYDYARTVQAEHQLQVGASVPAITGYFPNGEQRTLNYGEVNVPTVLYVFTPQCMWCKANLSNLRTLIDKSGSHYRLAGISLTRRDLNEYITREHLTFPVYADIDDSIKFTYKLGATPTTIVVSPTGIVLKVWTGVYHDRIRREIEQYLNVHLLECCSAQTEVLHNSRITLAGTEKAR